MDRVTIQRGVWVRVSSGSCLPTLLPEEHRLARLWFPLALSKCSNQQPFIELLEEGPRSCQEAFADLMLNLFFNTCWQLVLPELQGDAGILLCAGCDLTLSQEDLPRA